MLELTRQIRLGNHVVCIKNYHCVDCEDGFTLLPWSDYFPKGKPGLRLYVHITDVCNGSCPFCRRRNEAQCKTEVDPIVFQQLLSKAAPFVSSVAFTGGEPMLFPELTDELIGIASHVLPSEAEIDMVTNGTNLRLLPGFKNADRITAVHVSRHMITDADNRKLMGFESPSAEELSDVLQRFNDPGKVVLNCVLQTGGISKDSDIADYLDFAIQIGVKNSSFIGMFKANPYCQEHYVSPWQLSITSDVGCRKWNEANTNRHFRVWNRHADHDWCRCLTGSYANEHGKTRFYFRGPMEAPRPKYCRQLVYTADNQIRSGFGPDSKALFTYESMEVQASILELAD